MIHGIAEFESHTSKKKNQFDSDTLVAAADLNPIIFEQWLKSSELNVEDFQRLLTSQNFAVVYS